MTRKTADDKLAAKKAAVLDVRPKTRRPLIAGLALAIFLAGGAYFYFGAHAPETRPGPAVTATPPGDTVSLPTSTFDDGKPHYFQHKTGEIMIRYFVLKSADGVLRAAFDACDVCWPAGKGYAQDGEFMVCRNCGQRFHSTRINEVKGGCNPAPLERRVENGMLIIRVSDILEGKSYFDFAGKA